MNGIERANVLVMAGFISFAVVVVVDQFNKYRWRKQNATN